MSQKQPLLIPASSPPPNPASSPPLYSSESSTQRGAEDAEAPPRLYGNRILFLAGPQNGPLKRITEATSLTAAIRDIAHIPAASRRETRRLTRRKEVPGLGVDPSTMPFSLFARLLGNTHSEAVVCVDQQLTPESLGGYASNEPTDAINPSRRLRLDFLLVELASD
ncbi:hypothetical protein KM043_003578 [Ampulex compressa]|nr:hypothetical protein KM043_003578 [Ampulex compressa]